ncbi:MAG: Bug family tripartite tricarboxylate transporter substrate binding protein [Burkholderiales bacterium]
MTLSPTRLAVLTITTAAALVAMPQAAAQTWPAKPVRLVAPFTAGGPVDITARILAQKLTDAWGQQVVVDNRTGASGMIGAEMVAKSPPDGYTLLVNSSIHVIVPSLFSKMGYDPLRDFAPVTVVSSSPLLLVVTPTLPVKNIKEFVALAKARPGELSFASSGAGSSTHLTAELFKTVTGTKMVHVPYKGQSQALTDVISGQVPFMFNSLPPVLEFVKGKRLRAIGITAAQRFSALPEVPTFAESGYKDLITGSWYAVWAPAKTPEALITRLNADIVKIVNLPDVRTRILELGGEPVGNTPAEFDAFQKAEAARWAKVVKESGAKAE